jgi:formylglycine-generating enzyme
MLSSNSARNTTTQPMNDEHSFIEAMQQHPEDNALRLVFADWLEERGDLRGELIRLLNTLTQGVEVPDRPKLEDRLRDLVASGVKPVGPFFTNSIGMKFAWIPAGTFLMGSPESEELRLDDETQHKVTLTRGYWLGIHPVTQEQWQAVMGNNPSHFKDENFLPVHQASWDDCQEFLTKLNGQDGEAYRLPSNAEWEFACRSGTLTPFFFGDTIRPDQANYDCSFFYGKGTRGIAHRKPTPVGSYQPNAFGLHDMHGNVWEWCADWFEPYSTSEVVDPEGRASGRGRVLHGGSWDYYPSVARSAFRLGYESDTRFYQAGFRVARSPT